MWQNRAVSTAGWSGLPVREAAGIRPGWRPYAGGRRASISMMYGGLGNVDSVRVPSPMLVLRLFAVRSGN